MNEIPQTDPTLPEHSTHKGRFEIGCANDLALDLDGWALVPYSDQHVKWRSTIQRFDRTAATAIVDNFKSGWKKVKKAVIGPPIFKGHPDSPLLSQKFPDKCLRGVISDMEVTANGLRICPVLTDQDLTDVLDGWNGFSPHWMCNQASEENGVVIERPAILKSIGLLSRANVFDI